VNGLNLSAASSTTAGEAASSTATTEASAAKPSLTLKTAAALTLAAAVSAVSVFTVATLLVVRLSRSRIGRSETQRRGRDFEDPDGPVRKNPDIRSHAGKELQIFVIYVNHDVVSDDVLYIDRRAANLGDVTLERLARIGIHRERYLRGGLD